MARRTWEVSKKPVRVVVCGGAFNTAHTPNNHCKALMPYTLQQAAKATGKSKTALLRAIQGHKFSARKNENGQWTIDPAELAPSLSAYCGRGCAQ